MEGVKGDIDAEDSYCHRRTSFAGTRSPRLIPQCRLTRRGGLRSSPVSIEGRGEGRRREALGGWGTRTEERDGVVGDGGTEARKGSLMCKSTFRELTYGDAKDVHSTLKKKDQSDGSAPKWLYRGQTRVYRREWPPTASGGLAAGHVVTDGLLPSDARGMECRLRCGTEKKDLIAYDTAAAHLRAVVMWACLSNSGNQDAQGWLGNQALCFGYSGLYRWLSIGQHYGMRTACLDLTADPDVALSFATDHGAYISMTRFAPSVIYRFHLARLREAIYTFNECHCLPDPDKVYLVTLRDVPARLSARPARQRAWTLANATSGWFWKMMGEWQVLEVCHITHPCRMDASSIPGKEKLFPCDWLQREFDSLRCAWPKCGANLIDTAEQVGKACQEHWFNLINWSNVRDCRVLEAVFAS
jgi:hypothetical protein